MNNINCILCNKNCKSNKALLIHIIKQHNMSTQSYYDLQYTSGKCLICNKPTKFINFTLGYRKYCSSKCAANSENTKSKRLLTTLNKYGCTNISQIDSIKNKKLATYKSHVQETKERIKSHNRQKYGCDWVTQSQNFKQKYKQSCLEKYGVDNITKSSYYKTKVKLTRSNYINQMTNKGFIPLQEINIKYGTGWYQQNRNKITIYKNKGYIDPRLLLEIKQYSNRICSSFQQSIFECIPINAIQNTRSIIKPYELDIFIPSLNIAIECNGTWFHSINHGNSKEYHLIKSLLCREKNIRLIHIYEFENLNKQKELLLQLLNGFDNYPKNDFNKNNLLDCIPEPTIIYNKDYIVYGSGPLIKEEI